VKFALVGQALPSRDNHAIRSELSAREREVLLLLTTGATNREIAEALHVSAETVKKHAAALYRKLGVRNRTEAAQLAPELSAA
jgi:DNA-binding NarL/FixJ family response regulator